MRKNSKHRIARFVTIRAYPEMRRAQIAPSDFSADAPKAAGNPWWIGEDFWGI